MKTSFDQVLSQQYDPPAKLVVTIPPTVIKGLTLIHSGRVHSLRVAGLPEINLSDASLSPLSGDHSRGMEPFLS